MLLGISLDVPREVHEFVRKIQYELQEKFSVAQGLNQPPHITLKRPFERTDSSEFEQFLSNYVKDLKEFSVNIKGIGFFDEGVAYLKVVESQPLRELQKTICDQLESHLEVPQDNLEKGGFVFHLTLAYGDVSPEVLQKIKKEYGQLPVDLTFPATSVSLLRNNGEKWLPTKIYLISPKGQK